MYSYLTSAQLSDVYSDLSEGDFLWVLVGICLVFFMQAGFAMVETGFTRAKNAGNIIMKNLLDFCLGTVAYKDGEVPVSEAIPVSAIPSDGHGHIFSKVSIVTRPDKFEALKNAMDAIGITGMTLTQVKGCGLQHGATQYYRGSKIDTKLLPKIKLETVVTKIPVETVVEAAKKALYTGNYGDGKIFVYDVRNVIKIRTGEEGYAALQDEEE